MKKTNKKKLIIFITILIVIIASLLFIFNINKSSKNPSETIGQIQELNSKIFNLIEQNENLLSLIEDKYKQNQLKEALDNSLELKKAIQELTNDSLQITELLKNVVVNLGSVDKNNRAIFEEITQLEINAMNYLVSYSSYKEILSQQIGIEYESQLDNKTLENKADVLETTNQMKELLKNIKDNINSANKLLEKI
ncbi:MAG TPA: hypothetical protein PK168_00885 [Candidatus Paceibacterota bacterium]|jgi:hypothetical protein|nr:hypothetical protein [Parcubacteria group bacterium]HOM33142.1 hypothetical protein [Candidatus Paceibacterota bacterium]HPC37421.1 hypothetical protein [Candidatus Paceibacterota bacterium]HRU35772.1 hypothetical protein [Candidatus Paceibacterota bacterium]